MLKDHLGNVRMVITDEKKTIAYPIASMETAAATTEEALNENLPATRADKPSGYPTDPYVDPATNDKVAKVRGDGNKIGPAIILKVMAGDKFNVRVSSYYQSATSSYSSPNAITNLATIMAGSLGNMAGGKFTTTQLNASNVLSPGATVFLSNQGYDAAKPKAYLNWILLDEQFKYVGSSSGAAQVGAANNLVAITRSNMPVDKNGYLYIYVSNETPSQDVFFDNLQVTHIQSQELEETHYYPFGLTMAGISSKAIGGISNRYKFNGSTELGEDLGANLYETSCRSYDPQLGRFWQIDELAEGNWEWTPYNFAINNPLRFNDPFGLKEGDPNDPKVLPKVTVVGVRGDVWAKTRYYYQMMKYTNGDLSRIVNNSLREQMFRIDGIVKHRERIAEMTRASDKIFLAVAVNFIPLGHLTKLRYLKYAGNLFKLKRGLQYTSGAADLTSQVISNRLDITKVNMLTTASATLIGNPFLSTLPGAFGEISIETMKSGEIVKLNSVTDINVYKNIIISTAGNIAGEKLGKGFKDGSTLPGGEFFGEALGATGAAIYDKMTNQKIHDGRENPE